MQSARTPRPRPSDTILAAWIIALGLVAASVILGLFIVASGGSDLCGAWQDEMRASFEDAGRPGTFEIDGSTRPLGCEVPGDIPTP